MTASPIELSAHVPMSAKWQPDCEGLLMAAFCRMGTGFSGAIPAVRVVQSRLRHSCTVLQRRPLSRCVWLYLGLVGLRPSNQWMSCSGKRRARAISTASRPLTSAMEEFAPASIKSSSVLSRLSLAA